MECGCSCFCHSLYKSSYPPPPQIYVTYVMYRVAQNSLFILAVQRVAYNVNLLLRRLYNEYAWYMEVKLYRHYPGRGGGMQT
jgi:hypothetical protein